MLEMLEDDMSEADQVDYQALYHNATSGIAVVPYSFGHFPVIFGRHRNLTGDLLHEEVKNYLEESNGDNAWPCWEMNDHDLVKGR